MKKITVIQEMDLDEETIGVTEDNKVQSMFILTDQELTVAANVIQQFIFRKAKNSNYLMFSTGFQFDNEWYGDRPDDGVYKDPFTNKYYERKGNVVTEYVPPKPDIQPVNKAALIFEETWQGVKVRLANLNGFDMGSVPYLKNITYNGNNLGSANWVAEGNEFVFNSSTTAVNFQSVANVTFTYNGVKYVGTLPKIADNGGLGTFAFYGKEADDWEGIEAQFSKLNSLPEL